MGRSMSEFRTIVCDRKETHPPSLILDGAPIGKMSLFYLTALGCPMKGYKYLLEDPKQSAKSMFGSGEKGTLHLDVSGHNLPVHYAGLQKTIGEMPMFNMSPGLNKSAGALTCKLSLTKKEAIKKNLTFPSPSPPSLNFEPLMGSRRLRFSLAISGPPAILQFRLPQLSLGKR